jgi:hypothetical protein
MGLTRRRPARGRVGRRSEIAVDIERLVLDGFYGVDGSLVGRAVEVELSSGLSSPDGPRWRTGHILEASPARIDLPAGALSTSIGKRVGAAVHRAIRHDLGSDR